MVGWTAVDLDGPNYQKKRGFVGTTLGGSIAKKKKIKKIRTPADEALYYSTIFPNSRDLGTAE